jgi:hypothetical protein
MSEGADTGTLLAMPDYIADTDPMWQGATLRGDYLSGSLSGQFMLPRFDYFVVVVHISKTRPLEIDQGGHQDTLTVRMGPDAKKLTKVAVVNNEPDPITGAYRHTLRYRIRGDRVAYRFEWECNTRDPLLLRRLTLERGFFELYHMEDLEIVLPSEGAEDQTVRCVSSLVKKMRMDTSTRDVAGITDMIAAQGSDEKAWDSDWLHEYPQRYKRRKDFIRLIKLELKAKAKKRARAVAKQEAEVAEAIAREEGEALLAMTEAKGEGGGGGGDDMSALTGEGGGGGQPPNSKSKTERASDKQTARLEKSRLAFRERKRDVYKPEVDTANALVGKRIEMLVGTKWQRSMISECRIDWINDGLVPRPVHKIVPVDDSERKNGIPTWEVSQYLC